MQSGSNGQEPRKTVEFGKKTVYNQSPTLALRAGNPVILETIWQVLFEKRFRLPALRQGVEMRLAPTMTESHWPFPQLSCLRER